MVNYIGDALALVGPVMLLTAFVRIRNLGQELSNSAVSLRWRILNIYIAFFIVGYLAYAGVFWHHHEHWHDLIIIAILFLGSLFVLAVSSRPSRPFWTCVAWRCWSTRTSPMP